MKIWFTADYHLGHANIISYCKRPFKTLDDMNKTIIHNHNERVNPEDTIFFLGDFCFRNSPGGKQGEGTIHKAEYYLKQLNGRMIFIKGNHDRNNSLKTPIERVVIKYGGYRINLVHNPEHIDTDYNVNFVGHVHEKWKFKKANTLFKNRYSEVSICDMINVGVDVWKFMPISFEEIISQYKKWKKTIEGKNAR